MSVRQSTYLSVSRQLGVLSLFVLATYILAPMGWEPGGESLKNWVSARIFRETGGFPVLHHAPLYNVYLQFFLCFQYPFSIQFEHFCTHLFCYLSIYLLATRFVSRIPAIFLVCAWIPSLYTIEGGARVMGIGFVSLYLRSVHGNTTRSDYLPPPLLAAALFDTAFIPFLAGHAMGTVLQRYYHKRSLLPDCSAGKLLQIPGLMKGAMILVVVLTVLFQSERPDNNVHAIVYPWAPFPQKEILTVGNLQVGNWKYVMRNIPQSEWMYQDWFFTHKEAYGGASTLFQAVVNKPGVFFDNIRSNISDMLEVPAKFYFGFQIPKGPLLPIVNRISWVFCVIGFFMLLKFYFDKKRFPALFAVTLGFVSFNAALLLVHFTDRYIVAVLPVGLLLVFFTGYGLKYIGQLWQARNLYPGKDPIGTPTTDNPRKGIIALGILFICVGLIFNEWVLTALFSSDGILALKSRLIIWCVNLLCIVSGSILVRKNRQIASAAKRFPETVSFISEQIATVSCNPGPSRIVTVIVTASAICVLLTYFHNPRQRFDFDRIVGNPFQLNGRMHRVHGELLSTLNKSSRVLALESPWIQAFADVELENIYHVLFLPPFTDESGKTNEFLRNLNAIWISDGLEARGPQLATQTYLRYLLHLKPFLSEALNNGWIVREIEGYGKIFLKNK